MSFVVGADKAQVNLPVYGNPFGDAQTKQVGMSDFNQSAG